MQRRVWFKGMEEIETALGKGDCILYEPSRMSVENRVLARRLPFSATTIWGKMPRPFFLPTRSARHLPKIR